MNPYSIFTPNGYSILIMQPLHRESVFTILPAIIDTDTYHGEINFPFILNDLDWQGVIPAGTPMAQIIPFKRESWKHTIGNEKERLKVKKTNQKKNTMIFDSYKKQFWKKKTL
jgi:hypothetical protein